MASAVSLIKHVKLTTEDKLISYLPYPHSFEQFNLYEQSGLCGAKIGYYSGDPANLMSDLAAL